MIITNALKTISLEEQWTYIIEKHTRDNDSHIYFRASQGTK